MALYGHMAGGVSMKGSIRTILMLTVLLLWALYVLIYIIAALLSGGSIIDALTKMPAGIWTVIPTCSLALLGRNRDRSDG